MKRQIPSSPSSSSQFKRPKLEVKLQLFNFVDHVQTPESNATPLAYRHASSPGSAEPEEKPAPDSQDEVDVESCNAAPAPEVAEPVAHGPSNQYASVLDPLNASIHPDVVIYLAQDGAHPRLFGV